MLHVEINVLHVDNFFSMLNTIFREITSSWWGCGYASILNKSNNDKKRQKYCTVSFRMLDFPMTTPVNGYCKQP